ncbi:cytochrome c oxidase family protein-like protein, partial [Protomyces lactucae-debilis]
FTGKLRKQLMVDLSVAFGLGIGGGYAFWFGYHIPAVRKRDAYYAKLESQGTGRLI